MLALQLIVSVLVVQLAAAGGVPARAMLGAIGTTVSWSNPQVPEPGATYLGLIQYASIHDGALSDEQLQWLMKEYDARRARCSSHFHPHGAAPCTAQRAALAPRPPRQTVPSDSTACAAELHRK